MRHDHSPEGLEQRTAGRIVTLESEMVREGPPEPAPHPADKARGSEIIILRHGWQLAVLIAGLALPVILIIVAMLLR